MYIILSLLLFLEPDGLMNIKKPPSRRFFVSWRDTMTNWTPQALPKGRKRKNKTPDINWIWLGMKHGVRSRTGQLNRLIITEDLPTCNECKLAEYIANSEWKVHCKMCMNCRKLVLSQWWVCLIKCSVHLRKKNQTVTEQLTLSPSNHYYCFKS